MTRHHNIVTGPWWRRSAVVAAAAGVAVALGACHLLDVSNPNNVNEDALSQPASAHAQANGLVASVTRAIEGMYGIYSAATDEIIWRGSRDAFNQLDQGKVGDPFNEFSDVTFEYVGEASFMARQTIRNLEGFSKANTLKDPDDLIHAYEYGAVLFTAIGDQFDDFAFSNKGQAAANLGPPNMVQMYDSAIAWLDRGIGMGGSDVGVMTALRARAKQRRAIWTMLNPSGHVPANPLVNDAGAVADAQAALGALQGEWELPMRQELVEGTVGLAYNANSRKETKVSDLYNTLTDPLSGKRDPISAALIAEFVAGKDLSPLYVTSSNEMHLIIAEAALAQNDLTTFATHINAIRHTALPADTLPDWTGAAGQPSALQMLKFERQSALFLHGIRLSDMYRFGITDSQWQNTAEEANNALACPGIFFPITVTELQSNALIQQHTGCNQ